MRKFILILLFLLATKTVYSNTAVDFNWYWVFYENEKKPDFQCYTIRPFYLNSIKTGKDKFTASLIPVVFWQYKNDRKTDWKSFFGLIESVDYIHENGVKDKDFGVFPFLLYGSSPDKKDRYLHVWPFGGTIKGKLVQDRITTYLFPGVLLFFVFPPAFPPTFMNLAVIILSFVPLYVDYESRDYKAYGILWPLIQAGKSPLRDDKRILPFYAHNYKKDTYDNYSFFMIFNYGRTIMKEDEERTFFAFPFYGRRWNLSSVRGSSSLLWPFFSWGYDLKRDDFELNFPWPVVQWQTSRDPKIFKRIFFPVFGIYRYQENETFFVTPLYFSLKKHAENFNSEYYINALIIWYFKRDYKGKPDPYYGNSWRYFKIWPLFHYEYDDRGNVSFNLLSLLPLRDPEGYEKLYQPFWSLLEYKRLESGEKRFGLLLRLYYQRWGDGFINIKMPLLLSFSSFESSAPELSFLDYFTLFCYSNDQSGKNISVLFSMFGYGSKGDASHIRLFWIPIQISAGHDAQPDQADKKEMSGKSDEDENVYYTENEFTRYRFSDKFNNNRNSGSMILFTKNLF